MKKSFIFVIVAAAGIIFLQGIALFFMGQPPICECGYVKFWEGVVLSPGNSQHLVDWYSFSHIIHGFVFYALLWFLFPKMPLGYRFLLAVGIESAWEVIENTPWVINAYREQALAQGYTGDSIINSVFDTLFTVLGFWFALFLPVWVTVVFALALEGWVLYSIHDNLFLNVLNFIYQFEFIARWQAGG